MASLSPADLAALRAAVEAATPGPWKAHEPELDTDIDPAYVGWTVWGDGHRICWQSSRFASTGPNLTYIAAFDPITAAELLRGYEEAERLREALSYKNVVAAVDAATYGFAPGGGREIHYGRLREELLAAIDAQPAEEKP